MTREEADFIGGMNMCDEISNEAYRKIMCHCEEQEPCEDAVSRQAVKEKMIYYGFLAPDMTVTEFVEDCLPSVNPQKSGWIPVSERLPKDGGDYLVTIAFDIGGKEPVREVKKDYFCILSKKWLYEDENIIAWMPLPVEPYKAESEVKE